jgi:hypothetical protein
LATFQSNEKVIKELAHIFLSKGNRLIENVFIFPPGSRRTEKIFKSYICPKLKNYGHRDRSVKDENDGDEN